jgi:hypothetical protein
MKLIYAQSYIEPEGKVIFLAGPTPRSSDVKSWRPEAIEIFKSLGFSGTLCIPEFEVYENNTFFEYSNQIEWEQHFLDLADVILFWVPRELDTMPAFTTNVEFGYWLAKNPSKVVFGSPNWAVKNDYLKYMAVKHGIPVRDTLNDTIKETMEKA